MHTFANGEHFQFTLQSKHGVDLSTLPRGPLQLGKFTDSRTPYSDKQINESFSLPIPVADLVRDGVAQGFAQGGATLVEKNPGQLLSGDVTELQIETITDGGEEKIQATVRAKMQLKSAGGKSSWQGTIMGRAAVAKNQGVNAALQQALDKFVGSLFYEDYFLIQLVD